MLFTKFNDFNPPHSYLRAFLVNVCNICCKDRKKTDWQDICWQLFIYEISSQIYWYLLLLLHHSRKTMATIKNKAGSYVATGFDIFVFFFI